MLTPFAGLLAERSRRSAVGAFTSYDLEAAIATLGAAGAAGRDVIILIASRSYTGGDGALLLAALLAAAERAETRACVQLDHCDDIAVIESALAAGVGAVMADGSALPYESNVEFVRRAVELAHAHGAAVEAELGAIVGDEDVAVAVTAGALTEPSQAVEFIAATRADCLAVSIGNVHGVYRDPPALDWDRLDSIHAGLQVPLSLHGASGIPDKMLRRAIAGGIAKINVNLELRTAYLEATDRELPNVLEESRLAALHAAQIGAVRDVVEAKLVAFDARGAT